MKWAENMLRLVSCSAFMVYAGSCCPPLSISFLMILVGCPVMSDWRC